MRAELFILIFFVWIASVDSYSQLKQILSKAFDSRINDKNRQLKWNEFIEEQNSKTPSSQIFQTGSPVRQKIDSNTTEYKILSHLHRSGVFNQSFIDETKDPESPFYIATISSNIGGNHNQLNRQNHSKIRDSSIVDSPKTNQSGFLNKLFSYAFSTISPSRAMLTTKRPLITYINISNLEEHDSDDFRRNSLAETHQFSLLNSADPGPTFLQQQKNLPECATQQVCSAHYVKSNHTQRLCDCSRDFNWSCDDPDPNDEHSIDLSRKQEYKVSN